MTNPNQKDPAEGDNGIVKAAAYKWSCDTELPEPIKLEIEFLLGLAATAHLNGSEMHLVFTGVDKDANRYMVDTTGCPPELIPSVIMMQAEQHKWVAAIMCTEGWTIPVEDRERFMKERAPGQQIKDHPRAYEVLTLTIETLNGSWGGDAKIIGQAPNQIVREELVLSKMVKHAGRMGNLLPANWDKDPIGTLQKVTAAKAHFNKDEASPE
jgi:hypothetical protein